MKRISIYFKFSILMLLLCMPHLCRAQELISFNLNVNEGSSFYFTNTVNTENSTNQSGFRPTNDVYYNFTTINVGVRLKVSSRMDKDLGTCITLLHSSTQQVIAKKEIPQNNPNDEYLEVACLIPGKYSIIVEGTMYNGIITTSIECTDPMEYNIGVMEHSFDYSHTASTSGATNRLVRELWYRLEIDKAMELTIANTSSLASGTNIRIISETTSETIASKNFLKDNSMEDVFLRVNNIPKGIYYVVSKGKNSIGTITTRITGIDLQDELCRFHINSNNYVRAITYKEPSQVNCNIETQYFDGLGRSVQVVAKAASPAGNDIVTIQEYDEIGRESNAWLPISVNNNGEYANKRLLKPIVCKFYDDKAPFSNPIYECSPQNRVLEQYGPGLNWRDGGKSVKTSYTINTYSGLLACSLFKVTETNSLKCLGRYTTGELAVKETCDEDGHQTYTFIDKQGQIILQRQINETPHDTYFVYDDFNRLRFVIPPMAADELAVSGTAIYTLQNKVLQDYAYYYEYDIHSNCIKKKLPGCEPIIMRYDKADRMIFCQDGNQRASGKWSVFLYDAFGRPTVIGELMSASVPTLSNLVVTTDYKEVGTLGGYNVNITLAQPLILNIVNYYDDYKFLKLLPTTTQNKMAMLNVECYDNAYPSNATPNAKGLLTGSRVYQIPPISQLADTDSPVPSNGIIKTDASYLNRKTQIQNINDGIYLSGVDDRNTVQSEQQTAQTHSSVSVIYYDDSERIVQAHSQNHLGGYDDDYFCYSFTGKVLKHQHVHSISNGVTHTEVYDYTYDSLDRLLHINHMLNNGPKVVIVENIYDEVGRLVCKSTPEEKARYSYNLRGWTTAKESLWFKEYIYYNVEHNGSTPQYNGNISAIDWKAGSLTHGFTYNYDNLSRLLQADYYRDNVANAKFNTRYSYDKMGNILTIERNGHHDNRRFVFIDDVIFTYSGNHLVKAKDSVSGPYYFGASHFVDGTDEDEEYEYDENGNLTKDLNKNISSIEYNCLNLPSKITYNSGNQAIYTYDATGRKLATDYYVKDLSRMILNKIASHVYCGNYIYQDGTLSQILFDGGYITIGDSIAEYHYYVTDHLGNNRKVIKENGNDVQINDYYPFGTIMATSIWGDTQRYKYNGKELDRMNGLDWLDYGARHYDAALGRFSTMDPLAEKYYEVSPYAYCHNNPVNRVDPDGRDDYYDCFGNFLGSNNNETDYIYIADKYRQLGEWNGQNHYGIISKTPLTDAELSAKAWSKILTNTLSMMDGVDIKELEGGAVSVLKVSPGNGNTIDGEGFNNPDNFYEYGENASQINNKITAKIGFANEYIFATRSNIQNILGVEEYLEHMKKGLSHFNKEGSANNKDNIKIFNDIMRHPTWLKATPAYRKSIINYKDNLLGQ